MNSETDRLEVGNVLRDPHVAVLVFEPEDVDSWVDIVGGNEARSHIEPVAQKHLGRPDYPDTIQSPRVTLNIAAGRENVN